MKRFPIYGILLLLPAMAMVMAVGCNPDKPDGNPGKEKDKDKDRDKNTARKAIETPTDATVEGVVKFMGKFVPVPQNGIKNLKPANVVADCMAGGGNHVLQQDWLVGKDDGLANVVVSIEAGDGAKYRVADALRDSFKKKTVTLDQPFCAYVPHVSAVYAEVQPIVIKNSAKFSHNTNIRPAEGGVALPVNKIILPGETWEPITFKMEKWPINISCELHPFMSAKLVTFNHPYFAVTDEHGKFKIENVHSDTELVVFIWHESMNGKKEFAKKNFKKGRNTLEGIEIGK